MRKFITTYDTHRLSGPILLDCPVYKSNLLLKQSSIKQLGKIHEYNPNNAYNPYKCQPTICNKELCNMPHCKKEIIEDISCHCVDELVFHNHEENLKCIVEEEEYLEPFTEQPEEEHNYQDIYVQPNEEFTMNKSDIKVEITPVKKGLETYSYKDFLIKSKKPNNLWK